MNEFVKQVLYPSYYSNIYIIVIMVLVLCRISRQCTSTNIWFKRHVVFALIITEQERQTTNTIVIFYYLRRRISRYLLCYKL